MPKPPTTLINYSKIHAEVCYLLSRRRYASLNDLVEECIKSLDLKTLEEKKAVRGELNKILK